MNINSVLKNNTFRKYLGNTSWLLSEKILRMGLNLAVTALLARYLGPANFGILSYSQSFVALFAAFATLGLDQIVTRDIIQGKKDINQLLGTCFSLKVLGGLVVMILVFLTTHITESDPATRWMIAIISFTAVFQASSTFTIYFQAIVKSKNIAIAQSLAMIISSCFKLGLLFNNVDLIWFGVALAVEQLLILGLLLTVYLTNGKTPITWRYNNAIAKDLLKESWPLIFSTIVIVLYARIDQVMIKHMLNEAAVGSYAVAVRLSEATSFLPGIVITSLFPAIAKSKENGIETYHRNLQRFFDLICFIGFSIAIFFTLFSGLIVETFFGSSYSSAASILTIHIWGMLFSFLGVSSTQWLVLEKKQKYRLYRTVMGVIINIVLNFILIPIYGVVGAAIATLISQCAASYVGNLLSKQTWFIFLIQTKSFFFIRRVVFIYGKK